MFATQPFVPIVRAKAQVLLFLSQARTANPSPSSQMICIWQRVRLLCPLKCRPEACGWMVRPFPLQDRLCLFDRAAGAVETMKLWVSNQALVQIARVGEMEAIERFT